MAGQVTPYNDERDKKTQVAEMFDNIAPTYDFLNHFLSAGIDRSWRKKAIDYIGEIQPKQILDLATGTGDFAVEALRLHPTEVVGGDISEEMMAVGRKKSQKLQATNVLRFQYTDSEKMDFPDNKFDAITVGFGVRNFENLEKGLKEMFRVLKPGGRVAILEVSQPSSFPVKQLYAIYFHFVLPTIGRLFSKDVRAYTYLPESVQAFPSGEKFVAILEKSGFKKCGYRPLTFGICAFYTCEK
ncbi:MAG: bifunctional demethylmenaquinone methyltransferase/2-methoxy-6-polyprenyl-1,4-benzoquinol methylase UbiE [Chitinophagales bacterium]